MYKTLSFNIVGIAPLIMHNGNLANPLNKHARALKEVVGKRKKTEADHAEAARIEFIGGIYMGEDGPILPSQMVEAMVVEGAKKSKQGKQFSAGVIVEKDARLEYDGPRDVNGMFADERFVLSSPVKVGMTKIIRTRPIFHEWSATIEISYLQSVVNEREVRNALRSAGQLCGLGDWRPRHGRFALAEDMPALEQVPLAAE